MSSVAAVAAFFERLRTLDDPAIFISTADPGAAVALGEQIDARPAAEVPLRGMVFAAKDNIDVQGLPTTAACPAYAYEPAVSAFVVDRLIAAGAVPVAKTNMDQFATGLVGTRSPYGVPRNPHDPQHVPGGSSSGSAVAVARGLVDFALGTDTAGSGRVPAAFCGIVGLKPTPGLLSTSGSVPAVRSVDCISILTRDLGLAERVLAASTCFDPADPFARRDQLARGPHLPADVRLGVVGPDRLRAAGADQATVAAYGDVVESARSKVASVVEVDLAPFFEAGDLLYGGPLVSERTAAVGAFLEDHPGEVDPIVASIVAAGAGYDAVSAHRARYRLAELRRMADQQFTAIDVLLLPTVPHGARLTDVAAQPKEVNVRLGRFTTFANLLDLCALAIPSGARRAGEVPFGVTLYGPAFEDRTLLAVASLAQTRSQEGDELTCLVVAGAHLRGQPLEHQLVELGARFGATTRTAPSYRLFALAGSQPAKPGLVFDADGVSIEVDTWRLSHEALGRFLTMIPPPLALGTVTLIDGSEATGFVCEPRALTDATEITHLGGWRAYRAASTTAPVS